MIRRLLLGIILNGLALYGVIYFVSGITYTGGILFFVVGGAVVGVLNTIIKPIIKILTFPVHLITMGLSLILLNGVIFWLFEQSLDVLNISNVSMDITSIKTYFIAGFAFGVINWVSHLIFK
ncbi:phage holin family protein [Candidatus Peregrinibacteria bacterium]|nr:phage holin family protein [Candidatus Peregrinibacteria bacterium]